MKRGFTLIELMGVIIILGIISLITFPVIDKAARSARFDLDTGFLQQGDVAADGLSFDRDTVVVF